MDDKGQNWRGDKIVILIALDIDTTTTTTTYLKYRSVATMRNFSMNSSESRTAMWAARPIRALVFEGRAWWMSYRTSLTPGRLTIGDMMLCIFSNFV